MAIFGRVENLSSVAASPCAIAILRQAVAWHISLAFRRL